MWTILKVSIEFVTLLLLFYVLVFWPRGMWDLSSLTRDRTCTPCIGRWSLNHWTTREVPWPRDLECQVLICETRARPATHAAQGGWRDGTNCDGKHFIPLLPFSPSNLRKQDSNYPLFTDEGTEAWMHQCAPQIHVRTGTWTQICQIPDPKPSVSLQDDDKCETALTTRTSLCWVKAMVNVRVHTACDGQFYVSTWLGHGTQICSPALVWIWLWRYFLDEIDIEISRLWVKQIALHHVGGPRPIRWRP